MDNTSVVNIVYSSIVLFNSFFKLHLLLPFIKYTELIEPTSITLKLIIDFAEVATSQLVGIDDRSHPRWCATCHHRRVHR